jgi:hypothetical protein
MKNTMDAGVRFSLWMNSSGFRSWRQLQCKYYMWQLCVLGHVPWPLWALVFLYGEPAAVGSGGDTVEEGCGDRASHLLLLKLGTGTVGLEGDWCPRFVYSTGVNNNFLPSTFVWTKGFTLARQVLYYLNHDSCSLCSDYFWDRASFFVQVSLDCVLLF